MDDVAVAVGEGDDVPLGVSDTGVLLEVSVAVAVRDAVDVPVDVRDAVDVPVDVRDAVAD